MLATAAVAYHCGGGSGPFYPDRQPIANMMATRSVHAVVPWHDDFERLSAAVQAVTCEAVQTMASVVKAPKSLREVR